MTLLMSRRFLPLFAAQALGALADNAFKSALVVVLAFGAPGSGGALVALAGGLFILPYILVSAPAGQMADRFGKAGLIRVAKWAELGLSALAAWALAAGHVGGLLAVLFGYGMQAAFFSPLKYGILPELLGQDELLQGNAQVEAGTFAAILLGTIAGGALIGVPSGPLVVGAALVAVSAMGVVAAYGVPAVVAAAEGLRIEWNVAATTVRLLRGARENRAVWVALLGLSWFWTLGATFLAQFPVLAQGEFGADNRVVTLLLACFSVGVGLGSVWVGRLARGRAAGLVAGAGLLLSGATVAFVGLAALPAAGTWRSPGAMLGSGSGVAALACLLLVSACGGAFSVPLYARLQTEAAPDARARIVAANNVMNALCIVAGAGAIAGLAAAGVRPGGILLGTAAINAGVALWLRKGVAVGHERG